jgi:transposase InsO family protein
MSRAVDRVLDVSDLLGDRCKGTCRSCGMANPHACRRDRGYGGGFVPRAARLGIETVLTPFPAPRANAIAERVVRTLRNECLDHVLILNEQYLRSVLAE